MELRTTFPFIKEQRMISRDRLLGLSVILFCLIMWFWIIPQQTGHRLAAEFPHLVVLFLVFPALVLISSPTAQTSAKAFLDAAEKRALRRSSALLGLTTLYIFLVPVVGFYVCSTVALFFFLRCLGEKRWRYLCFLPVGMMAALYLSISKALSYPMPTGWFL